MTQQIPSQVLFIVGAAGSGSTILDMLLGKHSEIFSLGEFYRLEKFFEEDSSCTCGRPSTQCEVWASVREKLLSLGGSSYIWEISQKEAHWRQILRTLIQNHDDLNVTRKLISKVVPSLAFRLTELWKIYDLIAMVSGSQWLIDSSKWSERAWLAHKFQPGRSKVLYLTRDGRGVVLSRMKRSRESTQQLSKTWVDLNKVALYLGERTDSDKFMHVRYEELCEDTEKCLKGILQFIAYEGQMERKRFHNISGNRCRFSFRGKVREDLGWKDRLTNDDLNDFESVAAEMNRHLLGRHYRP